MLKKILAASTASVLALTALASTAMAADDNSIVFENVVEDETVTLELTNELTEAQIRDLLANTGTNAGADVADSWKDSANAYSNIVLSPWIKQIDNLAGKDANGNAAGTYNFNASSKDIKFGGATVEVKLQGSIKEYVVIPAGTDTTGKTTAIAYFTTLDAGYTAGELPGDTLYPKGTKGVAYGYTTNALAADDTANTEKPIQPKDWTKELTVAKDVQWLPSANTVTGFATVPVVANAAFGISATDQLTGIEYSKSSVKVNYTVSMPANMFRGMVSAVAGGSWDWSSATWGSAITNLLNSQVGSQVINTYFGVVGESGIMDPTFVRKGGVSTSNQTKVVKADFEKKSETKPLPNHGKATIGLGINATPTRLKNLNNGGTVTFEFDKDMWNGVFADVELIFRAASGAVQYPLSTDYKWSEDGKSITVALPAGLTYNQQLNSFNSFSMEYKVGTTHTGNLIDLDDLGTPNIGQYWGNNPTFWDANVTKITITANAEAPKDDNNGGLVSSDPSNSTSTPTNSGNGNGGDETNPGTGVAVAVAPVVLAAAGAAVVISKKRK